MNPETSYPNTVNLKFFVHVDGLSHESGLSTFARNSSGKRLTLCPDNLG